MTARAPYQDARSPKNNPFDRSAREVSSWRPSVRPFSTSLTRRDVYLVWRPPSSFTHAPLPRGLPYMTSALRGEGGQKIPQFCEQTVQKIRTKGGSKNPKILRMSYMEAPRGASEHAATGSPFPSVPPGWNCPGAGRGNEEHAILCVIRRHDDSCTTLCECVCV